jgi:hypothetical protein
MAGGGITALPIWLKRLAHRPVAPVGSLYELDGLLDIECVAEFDQ